MAEKFHRNLNIQRGGALIFMLVIMVMGTVTLIVNSLNKSGLIIERDTQTVEAMAQAKVALISYAITSENNTSETQPRPGNLPCPDTDVPGTANYGIEEGSCSSGAIGRLPWKSLGINELTDESGEPLWYAISGNFRRRSMNSNPINSDTQGTLDVYDNSGTTLLTPTGSKAAAIIFAPGRIIGSQQRNSASDKVTRSNYLDVGPNSRNNAAGPFISANKTNIFNDRLVFITPDQLFSPIEKRVGNEIKNLLQTYYSSWNAFPFAAPFSNPSSSFYSGQSGKFEGLTPVNALIGGSSNFPVWAATPSIAFSDGVTRLYCARSSGAWSNSRWRCCAGSSACSSSSTPVNIPAGVTVTITGQLNNVGLGFWKPFDITNINEVRVRNSSGTSVLATSLLDDVAVTGILNHPDGSADMVFSAKGKEDGSSRLMRIELRDINSYSSTLPLWFSANNWQRVMYYAISPGYAPGGGNTCSPLPGTPSCLTINGKGGRTDTKAIVVMPSKALDSQATHPSGTLADYLEEENATQTDNIFEIKSRSRSFNDQVISITP